MTMVEQVVLIIFVACVVMVTTTICGWTILSMIAEWRERKNK